MIANILNNAAKYTSEGGNILIRTQVRGPDIVIEIVGDGIGMKPEFALRAFDLFVQAERSSDRMLGGLGLGLALVRKLTELHQGRVSCASEGLGRGSTFTVALPRLDPQAQDQGAQGSGAMPDASGSLRVLVVDDNVDAATMLAMLLEASGHEALVEHGARRALERAKSARPQVCLLDIGLPEMDGNELARHLRAQPETAGALLIAVTGYGQEDDRRRALAAGFDHHLVKPVDVRKLATILDTVGKS